jgi:hypothetical protein
MRQPNEAGWAWVVSQCPHVGAVVDWEQDPVVNGHAWTRWQGRHPGARRSLPHLACAENELAAVELAAVRPQLGETLVAWDQMLQVRKAFCRALVQA